MSKVTYAYDMFDRVIGRSEWSSATSSTTEAFIYDGNHIVAAINESGAVTTRYLWGPQVNQLLGYETVSSAGEANLFWTLTDHQGSIRDIVDASGNLVGHFDYSAFGEPTYTAAGASSPSNPPLPFMPLFTGEFYDSAAKLQNNWHRWYSRITAGMTQ